MSRTRITWPQHSRERWFVSYADFVTLLFALFVVLFAVSQKDKGRAREISASIEKVLTGRNVKSSPSQVSAPSHSAQTKSDKAAVSAPALPLISKPKPMSESTEGSLAESAAALKRDLKDEIAAGTLRVSLEQRGLVVSLDAGAFFKRGDDRISPSARYTLAKLGLFLTTIPNPLRLEGHTDSLPIQTSRFQSNWELSAARSIAMLRLLADRYGIENGRMAIVGYADTASLESNETEEGREKNRRVDIVILNSVIPDTK